VLLQASWYSCFTRCVVNPLLDAGNIVVADTWGSKLLAKLRLRPPGAVDIGWAEGIFAALRQPDLVVYLRADPDDAAARKPGICGSETGGGDGAIDLSPAAFTAYQNRLGQVLDDLASQGCWAALNMAGLSPGQAGDALAGIIRSRLAGPGPGCGEPQA
jgi:hypothetical protein